MKPVNYKLLMSSIVALFFAFIITGCEKDDADTTVVVTESIDAKIAARNELSLFQAALIKTRLDIFTKGGGPFTIWVPTNAAFNALGINTAADLNMLDSNLLVQILTYHIQATNRSFTEIPLGPNATMTTQGGLTQYASRKAGGSAYVNGVKVTEPNIKASNGYMHVINRLLIPPFFNMANSISLNPDFKLMFQAITKTATTTTTNPLTIFAVPNSVMVTAGYDSTTIANATGPALTTLTAIIRYHFINKRIFSPDFVAGNLKTVQGTNVIILGTGEGLTVKGAGNSSGFQATGSDFIATTGVIHTINGLLKP
jgi:uncharacterized surface protein with fasciclin (FAS1) repeats